MLGTIASFLVRFLGSGLLDRILGHLEKKADSQVEREKLQTQVTIETIRSELAAREAARDLVIAEQGWWLTASIRPMFALPLALWWWAVIMDSIFQFSWNVASLPSPLDEWAMIIVGAYFITRPIEKLGRGYLSAKKGKSE